MNQIDIINAGLQAILPQIHNGFVYLKNNEKKYNKGVIGSGLIGSPEYWNSYDIANAIRSLKINYSVIITENGDMSFDLTDDEFDEKRWSLDDERVNYYALSQKNITFNGFTLHTFIEKPKVIREYRKGEYFSFTEDMPHLFAMSLNVAEDFLFLSHSAKNLNRKRKVENLTANSNCNGAIGIWKNGKIALFGDAAEIIETVAAVGGDTFLVKDYFKSVGFSWDSDGELWVRPVPEVTVETVIETVETVIETIVETVEMAVETVVIETPTVIETIETPTIETPTIETPTIETPTIETPRTYTRKLKDGRVIVCKAPVRKAKTVVETVETPKTDKKAEKKAAFVAKLETWISNNKAKLDKLTARGVKTRAKLEAKIARLVARLEGLK